MTTTTETIVKAACFQLVYDNGEPVDTGDAVPHYPTLEEAAKEAPRFRISSLGTPKPQQLDAPCVFISCTECGFVLDEDDAMNYHFLPDEVEAALKDWEWKADGDRKLCHECIKGAN